MRHASTTIHSPHSSNFNDSETCATQRKGRGRAAPLKRTHRHLRGVADEGDLIRFLPPQIVNDAVTDAGGHEVPDEVARARHEDGGHRDSVHAGADQLGEDESNVHQDRLLRVEAHPPRHVRIARAETQHEEDDETQEGDGVEEMRQRSDGHFVDRPQGREVQEDVLPEVMSVRQRQQIGDARFDAILSHNVALVPPHFHREEMTAVAIFLPARSGGIANVHRPRRFDGEAAVPDAARRSEDVVAADGGNERISLRR
mmetsp:Transcript_4846/g.13760  ORF Transcript_4846/g.13760 Transcript_4846/m.13760 type:complete len:257 (-) Transcript_4846:139-909(-)